MCSGQQQVWNRALFFFFKCYNYEIIFPPAPEALGASHSDIHGRWQVLQLDAACSPHLIKAVTASILTWLIQGDADGLNLYFCPSCCDLRFLLAASSCYSLPACPGSRHLFCPRSTCTFKPLLVHQVPASIRSSCHSRCFRVCTKLWG